MVAGHPTNFFFEKDTGRIHKLAKSGEISNYKLLDEPVETASNLSLEMQKLKPFLPKIYGFETVEDDEALTDNLDWKIGGKVIMENLTLHYQFPSLIDFKLGVNSLPLKMKEGYKKRIKKD